MFRKTEQMIKKSIFSYNTPSVPPGFCCFFRIAVSFLRKNRNTAMNRQDSVLTSLFRLLEADRSLSDFPAVCRRLHVLPGELNETLLREVGISGEELILRQRVE